MSASGDISLEFVLEAEKKHSVRYKEITGEGDNPILRTIYVSKACCTSADGTFFPTVRVTLTFR